MKTELKLKVSGIYKAFDMTPILSDVSIAFNSGEVHSLIGENASGKSTLVKIISGLLQPDSGSVVLNGADITPLSYAERKKMKIETVFQDIHLFEELNVLENIFMDRMGAFTKKNTFIDRRKMITAFNELADSFHIRLDPMEKIRRLSMSQKRFVELLRALSSDPDILILDEPVESFTSVDRELLFSCIERQRERGSIIIYVSHQSEYVMRISDRITVFFEGTVARTLTRENFDKNRLLKLIVGREYNNRYPKIPMQKGYPVLSLQNVTTPNLRDINLTLFEGEILGVTGLIGSGKTCVGRALVGLDAVTGGELKLGHRTVTNTSAYKMLTLGLTYIEAGGVKNLIPDFNAEKNITLTNLASVSRFRFIRPKLEDITKNYYFKRLAIAQHHRTLPVKHYSGGTKKKIAISKALYSNSHILVLDEPTAGMDSSSKSDLYNFMNDFISKGNSILLISSDFSEVAGMSDRVIIMSGGAIVKQLSREGNLREDIIHYSTFVS